MAQRSIEPLRRSRSAGVDVDSRASVIVIQAANSDYSGGTITAHQMICKSHKSGYNKTTITIIAMAVDSSFLTTPSSSVDAFRRVPRQTLFRDISYSLVLSAFDAAAADSRGVMYMVLFVGKEAILFFSPA